MIQGIEREGLRINLDGKSSKRKHPTSYGSKLTHPYITTDYSENLLEFITSPHKNVVELYNELLNIHKFAYEKNPDELIWPCSMPSILPAKDEDIDVADYGNSNIGMLKKVYRIGLGHRYGKKMQSIAGIHFNFSFDEAFWRKYQEYVKSNDLQQAKDEAYFSLIRNYKRYQWTLTYLFGASPVVHKSFLIDRDHKLSKLNDADYKSKNSTSLRMGGLGYTSSAQDEIKVCYNSVKTYIETLEASRRKSIKEYEEIGLKDQEHKHLQLNTNLLQIDNEFYSTVRPKRTAQSGESALQALHRGGVEYIEVRIMDVNPFDKLGISIEQIKFLQVFLFTCFTMDSKKFDLNDYNKSLKDLDEVVHNGQNLNSTLRKKLDDLFVAMRDNLKFFSSDYRQIIDNEYKKINDVDLLFSKKVMKLSKNSFIESMLDISKKYKEECKNVQLEDYMDLERISERSFKDLELLEKADDIDFDTFLKNYFEQIKIKEVDA